MKHGVAMEQGDLKVDRLNKYKVDRVAGKNKGGSSKASFFQVLRYLRSLLVKHAPVLHINQASVRDAKFLIQTKTDSGPESADRFTLPSPIRVK